MSRMRVDISNKQVQELLKDKDKYPTVQSVADKLGCTKTLVYSVLKGKRVDPKFSTKNTNVCACCKIRKKAPGNRFLCYQCFRTKSHLTDMDACSQSQYQKSKHGGRE